MHELGVVFYIIRDVKKVAEENQVKKVHSVTLELGEVSGVIFSYLEDCWNWAVKKEDEVLSEAKLLMEETLAITYCEDCQQTYPTVQYGKECPYCKSGRTYLVQGNEVSIKSMEVT